MHKPDHVETVLARLVPTALSEDSQAGISAMIDELAGNAPAVDGAGVSGKPKRRWLISGGIAASAAGIATLLLFPMASGPSQPTLAGVGVNSRTQKPFTGVAKSATPVNGLARTVKTVYRRAGRHSGKPIGFGDPNRFTGVPAHR